MSTKHPLRGVTCPRTPAEWAAALNVATATRATLHHAGVSLAGGEIHALHGLPNSALLSADGLWRVSWCAHDGYWDWEYYEPPSLEHRGSPTTTMWTKRNSSSGRFTS